MFIPNWNVSALTTDDPLIQAPDKAVKGEPYWFFRHMTGDLEVDVLDRGPATWLRRLEERAKFYVRQPWQAWRRRMDYDLVISHGAQSGLVFELLSSFSHHRVPHLMIDVGCLNGARINHTETPMIRHALRQAPRIVTHNRRQLEFYREYYPALAKGARFVPFGVDCDFFTAQPYVPSRTIVAFGQRKRDYDTLCQAFPCGQGWKLQIVGDTSLAPRYACDDIQFEAAVPLAQLMQRIAGSEAVVVPLPELPYSYGQMSLLQSMAMARPVICSLTTSTEDYVAQADCVDKVNPGDGAAMRRALTQMMQRSDAEREAQGLQCRQWVERHFTEAQMAQHIQELIEETV